MRSTSNVCTAGLLNIIGGHSKASVWRPHSPVSQCNNYCNIAGDSRYWGNIHIHFGGIPIKNIWPATKQLMVNLPDRSQIKSTHLCHITIPGLPIVLTGHIVPRLLIASLIGIRVLCKAGCKVVFTKKYCNVIYNNKVILWGTNNPSTNLQTLPINASEDMIHKEEQVGKSHLNPLSSGQPQFAAFTHSVQTRANAVKFGHQPLCNPKFSMLLKATRHGFLMGCPNINEKLILVYLNPSPATAKGHMKMPRHGIQSITPKTHTMGIAPIPIVPVLLPHVLPLFSSPHHIRGLHMVHYRVPT